MVRVVVTVLAIALVESSATEILLRWRMPPRDMMLGSRGASGRWYEIVMMNLFIMNWSYFEDGGFDNIPITDRCWRNTNIEGLSFQYKYICYNLAARQRHKPIVSKTHPIFIQRLSLFTSPDFECILNSVLSGILNCWRKKYRKLHDNDDAYIVWFEKSRHKLVRSAEGFFIWRWICGWV